MSIRDDLNNNLNKLVNGESVDANDLKECLKPSVALSGNVGIHNDGGTQKVTYENGNITLHNFKGDKGGTFTEDEIKAIAENNTQNNKINSLQNNKVDKVSGKQLSTHDFNNYYRDRINSAYAKTQHCSNIYNPVITNISLPHNTFNYNFGSQTEVFVNFQFDSRKGITVIVRKGDARCEASVCLKYGSDSITVMVGYYTISWNGNVATFTKDTIGYFVVNPTSHEWRDRKTQYANNYGIVRIYRQPLMLR